MLELGILLYVFDYDTASNELEFENQNESTSVNIKRGLNHKLSDAFDCGGTLLFISSHGDGSAEAQSITSDTTDIISIETIVLLKQEGTIFVESELEESQYLFRIPRVEYQ